MRPGIHLPTTGKNIITIPPMHDLTSRRLRSVFQGQVIRVGLLRPASQSQTEQLLYQKRTVGHRNTSFTLVILKILRNRHFFECRMIMKLNGIMKKIWLFSTLFLCIYLPSRGQKHSDDPKTAVERLKKDIPELMKKADVPGMSVALIHDGKLVYNAVFGVTNAATQKPVTSETVFEAASLSKPVFAYGVLKLVDEGKLNLDTPLNKYLGNNYDVVDDPRINLITARRVLSHTSGFPNWRDNDHTKTLLI